MRMSEWEESEGDRSTSGEHKRPKEANRCAADSCKSPACSPGTCDSEITAYNNTHPMPTRNQHLSSKPKPAHRRPPQARPHTHTHFLTKPTGLRTKTTTNPDENTTHVRPAPHRPAQLTYQQRTYTPPPLPLPAPRRTAPRKHQQQVRSTHADCKRTQE